MPRQLLPSYARLWRRHVRLYTEVFSAALQELSITGSLPGDEDAINERLCLLLRRICYQLSKTRDQDIHPPHWEMPIPPVTQNELKGGKIRKRPDFSCGYINPWANSYESHEISLHVECKRLGNPTSAGWILNKNYVKNGIKRFDNKTHEYGNRASSGMMVGYIISMTPKDIEFEVNSYQKKLLPDNSEIKFNFDNLRVMQTHQELDRKYVNPSQFVLIDLWVDVQNGD